MKAIFFTLFCCICSMSYVRTNGKAIEHNNNAVITMSDTLNLNKNNFDSFIIQFDMYEKRMVDKHFFNTRKEREGEMYIEITKSKYSSFIPYDSTCNCKREEMYYHPCYKIKEKDFYIVGINGFCDITTTKAFPYCAEILVTYNKCGNIIDFITVGYYSEIENCVIETTEKDNVLKVTQYTFDDSTIQHNAYSGVCEVSEYTITVNDDGSIDKNIIREYTDNVTLPLNR